jgi:peptidylprolyl isomerase/FKBP-type peptidyl-prolyl cis-trans isomerase FklB
LSGSSARIALIIACVLSLGACAKAGPGPGAASAGRIFLAANAKQPGVHVTPSGLQYRILQSGPASGPTPKETDEVKVNYQGSLLDGTVFDSTYERGKASVVLVEGMMPAWTEALQLMRPGDVWEIVAPAELAYRNSGVGVIPPGSVLRFQIELIAINPPPEVGNYAGASSGIEGAGQTGGGAPGQAAGQDAGRVESVVGLGGLAKATGGAGTR